MTKEQLFEIVQGEKNPVQLLVETLNLLKETEGFE